MTSGARVNLDLVKLTIKLALSPHVNDTGFEHHFNYVLLVDGAHI